VRDAHPNMWGRRRTMTLEHKVHSNKVARPECKEEMTNKQATGGKEEGNLGRMKRGEIKCSSHKAINGC